MHAAARPSLASQISDDYQEQLDFALSAGGLGAWEYRIPEQLVIWSPAVEHMHGLPIGSFAGTFEAYQRDIHPDDKSAVLASIQRVLTEHGEHELTYRIVRPDGEVRWLQAFGRLVFDQAGKPVRLIGVCRDVTAERDFEHGRAGLLAAQVAAEEAQRGQQRLVEILESIADPFSVFDEELRITFINAAALKLGGFTREQIVGRRPWDVVPESKAMAFSAAYERALRDKQPVLVEDYFEPWDRWFEARIFPLQNGISVYTRDVTDKKKADQLRERLARYALLRAEVSAALAERRELGAMLRSCCQAFVDQLGVAFARVWLLDEASDTLILHASAGLYTHTDGPHRAVPVGKFKIGLIAAERAPHLSNDVQHDPRVSNQDWAKREGMASFAGYPLLVDGRLLGVLAMFSKSSLAEDTLAALGATADLVAQGVARRLTEEELDQRVQELGRSNAELEQFAYVASHDLQEPLRVVASYNQLIARRYTGKLDKDADEFIAFTVDGVKRMQGLINDLLAYSRVGRRGGEFQELDLNEVLALARQNLERAIADEGAAIESEPLPKAFGDQSQLVQLLQNLLSNAIKFHGADAPRIQVTATVDGKNLVISVRDNGIGIEPQYFERIFVIFQRLHPRERYPGTGIGLAVCKKIVERHGGKIWAEAPPDKGSIIRFSLPVSAPGSKDTKS